MKLVSVGHEGEKIRARYEYRGKQYNFIYDSMEVTDLQGMEDDIRQQMPEVERIANALKKRGIVCNSIMIKPGGYAWIRVKHGRSYARFVVDIDGTECDMIESHITELNKKQPPSRKRKKEHPVMKEWRSKKNGRTA